MIFQEAARRLYEEEGWKVMDEKFEIFMTTKDELDYMDEIFCNVSEEDRGEIYDGYDF